MKLYSPKKFCSDEIFQANNFLLYLIENYSDKLYQFPVIIYL